MPVNKEINFKVLILREVHHKLTGSLDLPMKLYHIKKLRDILYQEFPQHTPSDDSLRRVFGVGRAQQENPKNDYFDLFLWFLGGQYKDFADFVAQKKATNSLTEHVKINQDHSHQKSIEQGSHITESLIERLRHDYAKHPDFKQISFIGDAQGVIGDLQMADDYIDVSYAEVSKLYSYQEHRIYQTRSQFMETLGEDQSLSVELLNKHNQIIAIGNPGVGKTTYARWVCHQWSKNERILATNIPLYINLKKLTNFQENNCLIDYIKRYFLQHTAVSYPSLFNYFVANHSQFLFLLDGFDELEKTNQVHLLDALNEISSLSHFILFTRSYALLDTKITSDFSIEILGFNEENKKNYLDKITQPFTSKTGEELLTIINNNPLLANLANTPLMISYIALAYIEFDELGKALQSIDSIYKLQKTVLRWVKQYYLSKKITGYTPKEFTQALLKGAQLAYEMEITQQYIYTEDGFVDSKRELCELLSKAGIGRLEQGRVAEWSFSFNTPAMQSFLAAEQVGDCLSYTNFMKFLSDQRQWRFCSMLVGWLCANNKQLVLRKIWKALQNRAKKHTTIYAEYCKFLFLSELDVRFLKSIANETILTEMNHYCLALTDTSANWRFVFLEIANKLLPKLDHKFQKKWLSLIKELG